MQLKAQGNSIQLSTMSVSPSSPITTQSITTLPRISSSALVHYMLNKHNGKCKYVDLIGAKMFGFKNKKKIKTYVGSSEGRRMFIITRMYGGDLICVSLGLVQLCKNYGRCSSSCSTSCKMFHLCHHSLFDNCIHKEHCKFFHNLHNDHNKNLVKWFHLDDLMHDDVLLYLKLRYCPENRQTSPVVEASQTPKLPETLAKAALKTPSTEQKEDKGKMRKGNGGKSEKLLPTNIQDSISICTSASLLEMLKEHKGCCTLKTFIANFPITLNCSEILGLLHQTEVLRCMSLFNNASTGEVMVLAKIKDLQLCYAYMKSKMGCGTTTCALIHLCEDFLSGFCVEGPQCAFSHNVRDKHNSKVLDDVGVMKGMSEDLELLLVRNSFPSVCQAFNSKDGCGNKFCFRFHICNTHIKSFCLPQKCKYGHSFETIHNTRLLQLYRSTSDNIKWQIVARTQYSAALKS